MAQDIERREFLIRASVFAGGAAASAALPHRLAHAETRQELTDLTAVVAVTAIRNGEIKAEDYARALLDRAQRLESLNAFRTLHGLPIPVKDSVNPKALPTSKHVQGVCAAAQSANARGVRSRAGPAATDT